MEKDKFDDIFSDEKLNKAIKRVRRKTVIRTVLISLLVAVIVFAAGTYANVRISINMSEKLYNSHLAEVKLTVPNGYISKTADTIGLLGGKSYYQISKDIGGRSIIMSSNNVAPFGFIQNHFVYNRAAGGGSSTTGQWPDNFWENGERKMIFFHPSIQYKEYKNDLNILNDIPDNKIIEMGISFDKPYKIEDIMRILPGVKGISWIWVDAYTQEEFDKYAFEAREYDAKAAPIWDFEAIGVSIRNFGFQASMKFPDSYKEVLQALQDSRWKRHHDAYAELLKKGYDDPEKVPILGVVVCGTKEELKKLVGNPHIKASSIGVTIDEY